MRSVLKLSAFWLIIHNERIAIFVLNLTKCGVGLRETTERKVSEKIMSTAKKRVVVVGYGGMGGWHVKNILKSDVCELAGVLDIKEERIALAKENGLRLYSMTNTSFFEYTIFLTLNLIF